jgi:hypothetical protein
MGVGHVLATYMAETSRSLNARAFKWLNLRNALLGPAYALLR